jgi:hypothetical protein
MKPCYYKKIEKPSYGDPGLEEYEELKSRNVVISSSNGFSKEFILVPQDSVMICAAGFDEISVELVGKFAEYAQARWDKEKESIISDFIKKVNHERSLQWAANKCGSVKDDSESVS